MTNGFRSWAETHHLIVAGVTLISVEGFKGKIRDAIKKDGHVGLYDLCIDLTTEFEKRNEGRVWDGEFEDEIAEFLAEKLS